MKYKLHKPINSLRRSSPSRGTWIEIGKLQCWQAAYSVVPLAGDVD